MTIRRHKELLDEFAACLDEERYYDAHESLEKIWFPRRFEDDKEMKLLKGFINAAVAFELVKRGRPWAADRAWGNYEKYRPMLDGLQTLHRGAYEMIVRKVEGIRRSQAA